MPQTGNRRLFQRSLTRSKVPAIIAALVWALLYQASMVHAVGLGRINVQSKLGQPFAAEIDLTRARLNQLEGYVELYRALGGGWTP